MLVLNLLRGLIGIHPLPVEAHKFSMFSNRKSANSSHLQVSERFIVRVIQHELAQTP